jgi:hypothetical protein
MDDSSLSLIEQLFLSTHLSWLKPPGSNTDIVGLIYTCGNKYNWFDQIEGAITTPAGN